MITATASSLPPKMFTTFVVILVCLLSLTLASQPPGAEGQTIQLSPISISDDITTTEFNASNEVQVQCDGDKYGFNPNVDDCENARSIYKRSAVPFTFGERHSGHGAGVFPLPFRFMGDQGLCYFEPVLVDSSLELGTATLNQFREAAFALTLQCAVRQSKGGIATRIGGRNIALVLGTYQPNVQCRGYLPTWASCRMILGDMPTVEMTQVFGPENDPAVQVPLPKYLESGDGLCVLRMFSRGRDLSSWFKIWEAASATYAVCLKERKVGVFRGLGELGNIFFTVTAKTPDSGNLTSVAEFPDYGLLEG